MNSFIIIFVSLSITLCGAQFYFHDPPAAQLTSNPYGIASSSLPLAQNYAHPSVVENAAHESQLPSELLKSDRFYKNSAIATALAKESWFTDKEMPVIDREAEKIPRDMVFKLFRNAGWIKRK